MKSEKGVTLSSLIIYVIAMSIVIATIATLTNYFYGNINGLNIRTNASKEYTTFNSYFVNEINTKDNYVLTNLLDTTNNDIIVFSSGNQFKITNNAIYFNKIKICKDVTSGTFVYDESSNKITVTMQISGKTFKNEYSLQKDI